MNCFGMEMTGQEVHCGGNVKFSRARLGNGKARPRRAK